MFSFVFYEVLCVQASRLERYRGRDSGFAVLNSCFYAVSLLICYRHAAFPQGVMDWCVT